MLSRAHELAETVRRAVQVGRSSQYAKSEAWRDLAELERLAGEAERLREALAEALDLLDDTSHGLINDGQQAWQDAYGRIHDAAGKPQRDETATRPWIAALEAAE